MKKLLILFCLLAITLASDNRDGGLLNRVGKMFDYLKNQPIVPKVINYIPNYNNDNSNYKANFIFQDSIVRQDVNETFHFQYRTADGRAAGFISLIF